MSAAWVVKAVDILMDGNLGVSAGLPAVSPDQLCFYGFEKCFDNGIVIAVSLAAHGCLEAVFSQDFLVVSH